MDESKQSELSESTKRLRKQITLAGGIASMLFFLAGGVLLYHSVHLIELRSVGGNSVAEAFYQETGYLGVAYAMAMWGLSALSVVITRGFSKEPAPTPITDGLRSQADELREVYDEKQKVITLFED